MWVRDSIPENIFKPWVTTLLYQSTHYTIMQKGMKSKNFHVHLEMSRNICYILRWLSWFLYHAVW
jgi:hypothetical protein